MPDSAQWPGPVGGWLFLAPEAVPERWQDRSREIRLVPLLPHEAARMLEEGGAPEFAPEELPFVWLVARGRSARAISNELGVPLRSVERRLARFRERFGVASTSELASLLSERGFR